MPFSVAFYRWMLDEEDSLTLEDLMYVDRNLYDQLKKFQAIAHMRDRLMTPSQSSSAPSSNAKKRPRSKEDCTTVDHAASSLQFDENDQRLLLDGCKIDDLALIFTLPGYPTIELKKGGKDGSVSVHNLDQYIQVTKAWLLRTSHARLFSSSCIGR